MGHCELRILLPRWKLLWRIYVKIWIELKRRLTMHLPDYNSMFPLGNKTDYFQGYVAK